LCVRFTRDERGRTATLHYQAALKRRRGWPFWACLGIAAAVGPWVVGVMAGVPRKATPLRTSMGEMAPTCVTTMGSPLPATRPIAPATNPSITPTTTPDE
jgi:hypothetical protein